MESVDLMPGAFLLMVYTVRWEKIRRRQYGVGNIGLVVFLRYADSLLFDRLSVVQSYILLFCQ